MADTYTEADIERAARILAEEQPRSRGFETMTDSRWIDLWRSRLHNYLKHSKPTFESALKQAKGQS